MTDKLLSLLGLCRKAGRLVSGFDAVAEAAGKKEARLILTANDLSPKSNKEIQYIATKHAIPVIAISATMEEIGRKTGKRAGIVAVTDLGFANAAKKMIRANEEDLSL